MEDDPNLLAPLRKRVCVDAGCEWQFEFVNNVMREIFSEIPAQKLRGLRTLSDILKTNLDVSRILGSQNVVPTIAALLETHWARDPLLAAQILALLDQLYEQEPLLLWNCNIVARCMPFLSTSNASTCILVMRLFTNMCAEGKDFVEVMLSGDCMTNLKCVGNAIAFSAWPAPPYTQSVRKMFLDCVCSAGKCLDAERVHISLLPLAPAVAALSRLTPEALPAFCHVCRTCAKEVMDMIDEKMWNAIADLVGREEHQLLAVNTIGEFMRAGHAIVRRVKNFEIVKGMLNGKRDEDRQCAIRFMQGVAECGAEGVAMIVRESVFGIVARVDPHDCGKFAFYGRDYARFCVTVLDAATDLQIVEISKQCNITRYIGFLMSVPGQDLLVDLSCAATRVLRALVLSNRGSN